MTTLQVLEQGWVEPKNCTEWHRQASLARFVQLTQTIVERRSKIRAAHRRWLRHRGMPFAALPASKKYAKDVRPVYVSRRVA